MNITRREENLIRGGQQQSSGSRRREDCEQFQRRRQEPTSRCPVKISEDVSPLKRVGIAILSGIGIGIGFYLIKKVGLK